MNDMLDTDKHDMLPRVPRSTLSSYFLEVGIVSRSDFGPVLAWPLMGGLQCLKVQTVKCAAAVFTLESRTTVDES